MKLSDEMWAWYRTMTPYTAHDSMRREAEKTAWVQSFARAAGGDRLRTLGLMTEALADDISAAYAIPRTMALDFLLAMSPAPLDVRHALARVQREEGRK